MNDEIHAHLIRTIAYEEDYLRMCSYDEIIQLENEHCSL